MNFGFTPEQEALRKEVSHFLDKETPPERAYKYVTLFNTSSMDKWIETCRAMAEKLGIKGWLALRWSREYGGQDSYPLAA